MVLRAMCFLTITEHKLTLANLRVPEVPIWVLVKEWSAFLAVTAHGVMLTVVTDTSTLATTQFVHTGVKVTGSGVVVTLAFCKVETINSCIHSSVAVCLKFLTSYGFYH